MFIIWKSETSIGYEEIATQHAARFGGPKKKDVYIRGIIHDIKRLEKATDRSYLQPSGGKRGEFNIDRKNFVTLQRTAVILLEIGGGYKHIDREIPREIFEQHIFDKYGWAEDFIHGRVEYAIKNGYLYSSELERGKQYIELENRFEHDMDYFVLMVEDYYLEQQREDPSSPIVAHLSNLIAQFHSDETSSTVKGGNT